MSVDALKTAALACAISFVFLSSPIARADQTVQYTDQVVFGSGEPVGGGGVLTREAEAIWASLALSDLDKKAAYTIWWVVFNNPDECGVGGCGEPDLFDTDVEASVFYAGGFITGTDGTANVSVHLKSGDIPMGANVVIGTGSVIGGDDSCGDGVDCDTGVEPGLRDGNGDGAEVHIVIRTHGKTISGSTGEMIATFLGQCDATPNNICEDQYALVFVPVP